MNNPFIFEAKWRSEFNEHYDVRNIGFMIYSKHSSLPPLLLRRMSCMVIVYFDWWHSKRLHGDPWKVVKILQFETGWIAGKGLSRVKKTLRGWCVSNRTLTIAMKYGLLKSKGWKIEFWNSIEDWVFTTK